jgi:hypothetical protein
VDNKAPWWEKFAKTYAEHLTDEMSSS